MTHLNDMISSGDEHHILGYYILGIYISYLNM